MEPEPSEQPFETSYEQIQSRIQNELRTNRKSVVDLLDLILEAAHQLHVSDIHLEPTDSCLMIRFRIDGQLYDVAALPKIMQQELIARLKVLGGIRIDGHQEAQDGRFSIEITGTLLDIRLSTLPTFFGENAVLRLLTSRSPYTFEELGLSHSHIEILKEVLGKRSGCIIVTGPTGSGKTSMLYALIAHLSNRSHSIVTLEDPIEYSLPGITQIQISKYGSMRFGDGIKSVLRQDPDIIAIGEIRDTETAIATIHAALTGHMVLATLHTLSATSTIARLSTLTVETFAISASLQVVLHQRLIRKLCAHCRVTQKIQDEQLQKLQLFTTESTPPLLQEYFISVGCNYCAGTGTSGRVGIFELLILTPEIRNAIGRNSVEELIHAAYASNFKPLIFDGCMKAAQGLVALDEVLSLVYEYS